MKWSKGRVIMRFAWLTNSMYDEEQNIAATGESPSTSKRYKHRTGNYFKFNCFNFLFVLQKTDLQLKLIAYFLASYFCCSTSLFTVFAKFWFFFWCPLYCYLSGNNTFQKGASFSYFPRIYSKLPLTESRDERGDDFFKMIHSCEHWTVVHYIYEQEYNS